MSNRISVTGDHAEQVAEVETGFEWAVRAGIVCFGVVHLLIAWIALNLAFGESSKAANQNGALQPARRQPLRRPSCCGRSAIGFVALVVWQVLEARRGLALRGAASPSRRQGGRGGRRQGRDVRRTRGMSVRPHRDGCGQLEHERSTIVTARADEAARWPGLVAAVGIVIIVDRRMQVKPACGSLSSRTSTGDATRATPGPLVVQLGQVGIHQQGDRVRRRRRSCSSGRPGTSTRRRPAGSTWRCRNILASRSARAARRDRARHHCVRPLLLRLGTSTPTRTPEIAVAPVAHASRCRSKYAGGVCSLR